MTPTVSVSFPVEPHVRKYLIKRYGSAHVAQTIGKQTLLGMLVLDSLTKVFRRRTAHINGQYRYTVLVPKKYFNEFGHSLNRHTEQYLGACSTKMFNEALYEYLDQRVELGEMALPALKTFMEMYWITEDDAKVESLYKAYQRHCRMAIKSDQAKKNRIQGKKDQDKKG